MEEKPMDTPSLKTREGKSNNSFWSRPGFQIFLFLPVIILMTGDLAIILSNKLLIIIELGLPLNAVDIIIAITFIVQGLSTFYFGYLSDKMKRKNLLLLGAIIWSISEILSAFAWNFSSLLVLRIIAAIGLGAQSPVSFSLLSDLFPSERRSNSFAWWGIANMIGSIVVGGLALTANEIDFAWLDQNFHSIQDKIAYITINFSDLVSLWRQPYIQVGILGLILVVLVFFVKEPKRAAKEKQLEDVLKNEEIDYSKQYTINKNDLKFVFKRKTNIFLVLNFFDNVTSGVIVSNLILYITLEIGINLDFTNFDTSIIFLVIGLLIALGIALWGQFYFAQKGDKMWKNGDKRGRVKIMTYCAIFMVPFLTVAFAIAPSVGHFSIFKNTVVLSPPVFWTVFLIMFLLIGIGLAGSFGGTPNWYASLIDGNLPEQRGTMIAIASFMDTVGRSIGTFFGGYFIASFTGMGDPAPIGTMMLTMQLIFGSISAIMTIPALKTCEKDLTEVENILELRAKELQDIANKK